MEAALNEIFDIKQQFADFHKEIFVLFESDDKEEWKNSKMSFL